MRFTNKDLANAMGLKIGDRIIVKRENDKPINYELKSNYSLFDNMGYYHLLDGIIDEDYEILPRKKKVGELICREIEDCSICPLRGICDTVDNRYTLFDILEDTKVKRCNDKEIYDILKSRLDKEVEDE